MKINYLILHTFIIVKKGMDSNMNEDNMSNIVNKLNKMMQNNEIPDNLKDLIDNFKNSSKNNEHNSKSFSVSSDNNSNSDFSNNFDSSANSDSSADFDIATIMKMKQIIDSMHQSKDDPRTNLLLSLKPYLKESRRQKVDQYIKLFGIGKAFELFNSLGGEEKHDV